MEIGSVASSRLPRPNLAPLPGQLRHRDGSPTESSSKYRRFVAHPALAGILLGWLPGLAAVAASPKVGIPALALLGKVWAGTVAVFVAAGLAAFGLKKLLDG